MPQHLNVERLGSVCKCWSGAREAARPLGTDEDALRQLRHAASYAHSHRHKELYSLQEIQDL